MNEDEILTAQPQGLSPALRAQGVRYQIEGDDLCIRISVDAIGEIAEAKVEGWIKDKAAVALAMARELIDCEDPYTEEPYIYRPLDAALERVFESADPSIGDLDEPRGLSASEAPGAEDVI